MKKHIKLFIAFIIAISVVGFVLSLNGSVSTFLELTKNAESLTYGEGPGDSMHRHNQAVNCPTWGVSWNIKPGCCWGYSTCDFEVCSNQSGC